MQLQQGKLAHQAASSCPEVGVCAVALGRPPFKDNVAYLSVVTLWISAVVTEAFSPAEITVVAYCARVII